MLSICQRCNMPNAWFPRAWAFAACESARLELSVHWRRNFWYCGSLLILGVWLLDSRHWDFAFSCGRSIERSFVCLVIRVPNLQFHIDLTSSDTGTKYASAGADR